jgi:hypothetical protein
MRRKFVPQNQLYYEKMGGSKRRLTVRVPIDGIAFDNSGRAPTWAFAHPQECQPLLQQRRLFVALGL